MTLLLIGLLIALAFIAVGFLHEAWRDRAFLRQVWRDRAELWSALTRRR